MRHLISPIRLNFNYVFNYLFLATFHNSIGDIVCDKCQFKPHKSNNCLRSGEASQVIISAETFSNPFAQICTVKTYLAKSLRL